MATYDEIEEALECMGCCDALEEHLRYCESDECGVFETYWRTRARIEAGDHWDWRSPARMAMAVMMIAESWMHECHDHRVVHRNAPVKLNMVEPDQTSVVEVPDHDLMQRLARERLVRLKESRRPSGAAQRRTAPPRLVGD